MNHETERWQKLNAYVDGELAPADAAEVAARVADDRRMASVVATLTRLKAVTAAAALEGASMAVVPMRPPGRRRWAMAAAAALVVAGAAGALVGLDRPDARVAALVERHLAWASQDERTFVDSATAAHILVAMGRLGITAEIPDLTDAGLQVARISVLDPSGAAAGLHVGYVGNRGCRVSLVIEPAAADRLPAAAQSSSAEYASWVVKDVAYSLIAVGMHPPRFAMIAARAEAATRDRAPLAEPMREALRDQRDASPPCVG